MLHILRACALEVKIFDSLLDESFIVSLPAFDSSRLLEEIAGPLSLFARRQPFFCIADGKVRVDLRHDKVST